MLRSNAMTGKGQEQETKALTGKRLSQRLNTLKINAMLAYDGDALAVLMVAAALAEASSDRAVKAAVKAATRNASILSLV
jgi:hypothetical protein